jgi:hypothetical protein
LHGATAGWGDELLGGAQAAVQAATGGGDFTDLYEDRVKAIRDTQRQYEEQHPAWAMGTQIIGAAAPASKVAKFVPQTLPMLAAEGAGYGATEYLGDVDYVADPDQEKDFDTVDFLTQTGLSTVAAPVMVGGTRAMKNLFQYVRRNKRDIPAEQLKVLADNANMTPEQLLREADKLGPEASLVDVTGDVGTQTAQGVSIGGGQSVADVFEKNLAKVQGSKQRIRDQLKESTGKGDMEYHGNLERAMENRRARADVNYGKALEEDVIKPTKTMQSLIENNPAVREAWERVRANAEARGEFVPQMYQVDEAGKIVGWNKDAFPTAKQMQEMKWEMDAVRNSLEGSTDAAGKNLARRFREDHKRFKDELYSMNDNLRLADKAYAGDSAIIGAQQQGVKEGLNRINVQDQLKRIDDMSASEREAYLDGVMSYVYDKLGKNREELVGQLTVLDSENAHKVLKELVGERGADDLLKRIKAERRFRDVEQKIRGGSQTEIRKGAAERTKELINPQYEFFQAASDKGWTAALAGKIQNMLPKFGGASTAQINELADLMTRPGGVPEAIERMRALGASEADVNQLLQFLNLGGFGKGAAVGGTAAVSEGPSQGLFDYGEQ